MRRLVPRPWPTRQKKDDVERFIKELEVFLESLIAIWFFDESGIRVGSKPRKVLALKGSKPTYPYNGDHIRITIMGAVNIKTGQLETLLMPTSNTETFQVFLDYFNTKINKTNIFILDNASWHKTGRLNWGRIKPVYLPPYSPNLNPIEGLWKILKDLMPIFTEIVNIDELEEAVITNLKYFFDNPQEVMSICNI